MPPPVKLLISWDDDAAPGLAAGAVELDAVSLIGFESAAEVTEHPVETGASVGDHVRPTNGTVTMEGVITDAPIALPTTQAPGVSVASGTVSLPGGGTAVSSRFSGTINRMRLCDETLRGLVESGALVSVTSGLRTADSLAITRYRPERNADTGNSMKVTMELKRVRIATTARAPVPAVRRAQVQLDRGSQPADNRTAAARLADTAPMRRLAEAMGAR